MKKIISIFAFFFAMQSTILAQEKPTDILGVTKISIGDSHFALHSSEQNSNGLWTQKYLPIILEKKSKEQKEKEKDRGEEIKFVENPKESIIISFENKDRDFLNAFENAEETLKISEEFKRSKISEMEGSAFYQQSKKAGKADITENVYLRVKRIEKPEFKGIAYFQYFYPQNPENKNLPKFDHTFTFPDIQLIY